jgi:hypothetical protein
MHTGFRWGNLTREDEEALGVNGSIILKWILNKLGREWINLGQDKNWEKGGCCKEGYEPSDSTKRGEFLEYLTGYEILTTDSALQNQLISWFLPSLFQLIINLLAPYFYI